MNKSGLLILAILGFILISPLASAWWNESWSREVFVDINESIPGSYTQMFEIDYDNDMRSDYGDLRVINENRTGALSYWIENYSAEKAWVYINFTEDFYFYYGNPNVSTTSDTDNLFSFFDHFEGSSLSGSWTNGDYGSLYDSISGSILTFNGGDGCCTDRSAKTTSTWGANHSFIMKTNFVSTGGQQKRVGLMDASYIWNTGSSASYFFQWGDSDVEAAQWSSTWLNEIVSLNSNAWRKYEVNIFDGRTLFYINNTLVLDKKNQTSNSNSAKNIYIASNTGLSKIDWVAIRASTYPEPTHSLGQEQTIGGSPPNTTAPTITPNSPIASDNLNCNATLTDDKQISLTAFWKWFKNGVLQLSGSTEVTSGINSLISTLNSGNTTKGENWICQVKPNDGYNNGTIINSTQITIQNTAPNIPIQLLPENQTGYKMGSTIIFIWNNSQDADNDSNITYNLEIYNESDMAAEHLINSNYSITEGTANTSISITLSDYSAIDDDYYWRVGANDSEDFSWSSSRNFQYANWTITFNLTDSFTGEQISTDPPEKNIHSISCDNGFNSPNSIENTYVATDSFAPGTWECTFIMEEEYLIKVQNITVNQDETIEISMSESDGLTEEEHTWLEAIYDCINGGDCALYNLLLEVNNTVGNIWEHTAPTDESVVLSETVTNKVVNTSNNLTIDYQVYIPIKAGYGLGDYLPIRIGYFFLDQDNETCFNQGEKPIGVSDPYCQPLIIETLGPMGGTLNFTVELQPSLVNGSNYSIKRTIDIDPLGVWYNYGSEVVSNFVMLETLSTYGASSKTTGQTIPSSNEGSSESSSNSGSSSGGSNTIIKKIIEYITSEGQENKELENDKETIKLENKPGITGGVIGTGLFSGGQIIFMTTLFLSMGLVILHIFSRRNLKKK